MPRNTYVATLKFSKGRAEQLIKEILKREKFLEYKTNFGERFWKKGKGWLQAIECLNIKFDHSESITIQGWIRGGSLTYGFREISLYGAKVGGKKKLVETIAEMLSLVTNDEAILADPVGWVISNTPKDKKEKKK